MSLSNPYQFKINSKLAKFVKWANFSNYYEITSEPDAPGTFCKLWRTVIFGVLKAVGLGIAIIAIIFLVSILVYGFFLPYIIITIHFLSLQEYLPILDINLASASIIIQMFLAAIIGICQVCESKMNIVPSYLKRSMYDISPKPTVKKAPSLLAVKLKSIKNKFCPPIIVIRD
jgi:hypothetical protein